MYNDDENAYMEQEDEWEREGLLDPAWEKQQKKVRSHRCIVARSQRRFESLFLVNSGVMECHRCFLQSTYIFSCLSYDCKMEKPLKLQGIPTCGGLICKDASDSGCLFNKWIMIGAGDSGWLEQLNFFLKLGATALSLSLNFLLM